MWRVVMHVLACAVAALAVATVGAAAASASASAPASVGLRSRALHAAPPTRAPVAVAIEHHRVEVETTPLMWCDEEACTGALARVQETFTLVTTCRVVASGTPTDSGVRVASGDAGVTTRTVLCPGRRRCSLGSPTVAVRRFGVQGRSPGVIASTAAARQWFDGELRHAHTVTMVWPSDVCSASQQDAAGAQLQLLLTYSVDGLGSGGVDTWHAAWPWGMPFGVRRLQWDVLPVAMLPSLGPTQVMLAVRVAASPRPWFIGQHDASGGTGAGQGIAGASIATTPPPSRLWAVFRLWTFLSDAVDDALSVMPQDAPLVVTTQRPHAAVMTASSTTLAQPVAGCCGNTSTALPSGVRAVVFFTTAPPSSVPSRLREFCGQQLWGGSDTSRSHTTGFSLVALFALLLIVLSPQRLGLSFVVCNHVRSWASLYFCLLAGAFFALAAAAAPGAVCQHVLLAPAPAFHTLSWAASVVLQVAVTAAACGCLAACMRGGTVVAGWWRLGAAAGVCAPLCACSRDQRSHGRPASHAGPKLGATTHRSRVIASALFVVAAPAVVLAVAAVFRVTPLIVAAGTGLAVAHVAACRALWPAQPVAPALPFAHAGKAGGDGSLGADGSPQMLIPVLAWLGWRRQHAAAFGFACHQLLPVPALAITVACAFPFAWTHLMLLAALVCCCIRAAALAAVFPWRQHSLVCHRGSMPSVMVGPGATASPSRRDEDEDGDDGVVAGDPPHPAAVATRRVLWYAIGAESCLAVGCLLAAPSTLVLGWVCLQQACSTFGALVVAAATSPPTVQLPLRAHLALVLWSLPNRCRATCCCCRRRGRLISQASDAGACTASTGPSWVQAAAVVLVLAAAVVAVLGVATSPVVAKTGQYAAFQAVSRANSWRIALRGDVDTSWDGQSRLILDEWMRLSTAAMPSATQRGASSAIAVGGNQVAGPDGATPSAVAPYIVDVGAHDGLWLSNSNLFLQHGWGGLLIEPNPAMAPQLKGNVAAARARVCQQRDDCGVVTVANVGIGPESTRAWLAFRGWWDATESATAAAGSSEHAMCTTASPDGQVTETTGSGACVDLVPLKTLLVMHHVPRCFGVLSVDTETSSQAVVAEVVTVVGAGFTPAYLILENAHDTEARVALAAIGYEFVAQLRYDGIYRATRATLASSKCTFGRATE